MHSTYKRLLEKLNKKYPEKHIDIATRYKYYAHNGGYYKTEHNVYVEDIGSRLSLPTLNDVKKHVQYLCKKEA